MIYILGARGRLGQALAARYDPDDVICLGRDVYQEWSEPGAVPAIRTFFADCPPAPHVIYICSGLLDPRLTAGELMAINYRLPRNVIESVAELNIRVVTFGTAMEHALANNSYVQSKLKLSEYVDEINAQTPRALHVRIHTQYGSGEPSPFMFLGQILTALRTDRPFAMTQGRQLREYHHVEDDAKAIQSLVAKNLSGIVELSHGSPVSLRSLAQGIFDAFGKAHLLQLGALPEPVQENFDRVFTVPEALKAMSFRDANSAVIEYMKSRMSA